MLILYLVTCLLIVSGASTLLLLRWLQALLWDDGGPTGHIRSVGRIEWMFPIRGRWLRFALLAVAYPAFTASLAAFLVSITLFPQAMQGFLG